MDAYFNNGNTKYKGRCPTSLPGVINKDLSSLKETSTYDDHSYSKFKPHNLKLETKEDLDSLRELANDRKAWRALIGGFHCAIDC